MSIENIITRDVDVIESQESVQMAANRMHTHNVGCLVVVDREQQPIGMLTDRDLAVRVVACAKDPRTTSVGEVMSQPVATVDENASMDSALTAMRAGPYRRMPAVNLSGELVGLITLDDILGHLTSQFGLIRLLLHKESPASLV
jgi:CBS domain-containing protein